MLQTGWTSLHVAAESDLSRVVEILIKSKADVNAVDKVLSVYYVYDT